MNKDNLDRLVDIRQEIKDLTKIIADDEDSYLLRPYQRQVILDKLEILNTQQEELLKD